MSMKKIYLKYRNVAVVLLGMGIVSACADYLDVPLTGKIAESEFYKTETDAALAATAAYDQLSNCYNNVWASMYLLREIRSDDVNAGGADDKDQQGHQLLDDFKIDSQNDQMLPAWRNLWQVVYRTNKLINKTIGDTPVKARLIAEGKFLRALCYHDLVTFWGDVPLVLTEIPVADFGNVPRVATNEVYDQIEKDLEEAIPDLPTRDVYGPGDRFRVSKGAAQALLGKVHLYQEEFDEAITALDAVINSGKYSLEAEAIWAFSVKGEFGKESVFEVNYVNTQQYDWSNYPWNDSKEDNIIVQLMGPRGIDGTEYKAPPDPDGLDGPIKGDSITLGWGFVTPTEELYDSYVAAGDVSRRRSFVMSVDEFEAIGGIWTPDDWDFEGMLRRKYGHFTTESGPPVTELNHTTNWKLIRYSDVLLMAAEAYARDITSPNEAQARIYLNMVRQRPGNNGELADVAASGAALMDAIVLERRLELAFEGHRFADLVRWGLADDELSDLGFVAGKHELLPIPTVDIIATGWDQNQNY